MTPERVCTKCKTPKILENFNAHKGGKYGKSSICKSCIKIKSSTYQKNNKDKVAILSKNYRLRNPDRFKINARNSKYKLNYGITIGDYNIMFEKQNGKCAICKSTESKGRSKEFYIDHDHSTGKVRALLCNTCNAGLGKFKDDSILLLKAIEYLKFHKEKSILVSKIEELISLN